MLFNMIPTEVAIKWEDILIEEGVDEETATKLIAWIRSEPVIMGREPDEKAIPIVEEILDSINLEEFGVKNPESVKKKMLEVLKTEIQSKTLKTTEVSYHEEITQALYKEIPALCAPQIPIEAESNILAALLDKVPIQVVKEWKKILEDEGLDENTALEIIAQILSDPRISSADTIEAIKETVREIIDEIDWDSLGVSESVKDSLLYHLDLELELQSSSVLFTSIQEATAAVRGESFEEKVDKLIESTFEEFKDEISDLLKEKPDLENVIKKFAKTVVWRLRQTP